MNSKCWNKSRGREHNGICKDEVPRGNTDGISEQEVEQWIGPATNVVEAMRIKVLE